MATPSAPDNSLYGEGTGAVNPTAEELNFLTQIWLNHSQSNKAGNATSPGSVGHDSFGSLWDQHSQQAPQQNPCQNHLHSSQSTGSTSGTPPPQYNKGLSASDAILNAKLPRSNSLATSQAGPQFPQQQANGRPLRLPASAALGGFTQATQPSWTAQNMHSPGPGLFGAPPGSPAKPDAFGGGQWAGNHLSRGYASLESGSSFGAPNGGFAQASGGGTNGTTLPYQSTGTGAYLGPAPQQTSHVGQQPGGWPSSASNEVTLLQAALARQHQQPQFAGTHAMRGAGPGSAAMGQLQGLQNNLLSRGLHGQGQGPPPLAQQGPSHQLQQLAAAASGQQLNLQLNALANQGAGLNAYNGGYGGNVNSNVYNNPSPGPGVFGGGLGFGWQPQQRAAFQPNPLAAAANAAALKRSTAGPSHMQDILRNGQMPAPAPQNTPPPYDMKDIDLSGLTPAQLQMLISSPPEQVWRLAAQMGVIKRARLPPQTTHFQNSNASQANYINAMAHLHQVHGRHNAGTPTNLGANLGAAGAGQVNNALLGNLNQGLGGAPGQNNQLSAALGSGLGGGLGLLGGNLGGNVQGLSGYSQQLGQQQGFGGGGHNPQLQQQQQLQQQALLRQQQQLLQQQQAAAAPQTWPENNAQNILMELGRTLAGLGITVEEAINAGLLGGLAVADVKTLCDAHNAQKERMEMTGVQPQPQYAAQLFAAGGLPLPTKAASGSDYGQPFNAVIGAERPRSVPPRGPSPAFSHSQERTPSAVQQGISPFSLAPAGSFGSEASMASREADGLFRQMRSQSQVTSRMPPRPESVTSAQSAAPKLETVPTPRAATTEGFPHAASAPPDGVNAASYSFFGDMDTCTEIVLEETPAPESYAAHDVADLSEVPELGDKAPDVNEQNAAKELGGGSNGNTAAAEHTKESSMASFQAEQTSAQADASATNGAAATTAAGAGNNIKDETPGGSSAPKAAAAVLDDDAGVPTDDEILANSLGNLGPGLVIDAAVAGHRAT